MQNIEFYEIIKTIKFTDGDFISLLKTSVKQDDQIKFICYNGGETNIKSKSSEKNFLDYIPNDIGYKTIIFISTNGLIGCFEAKKTKNEYICDTPIIRDYKVKFTNAQFTMLYTILQKTQNYHIILTILDYFSSLPNSELLDTIINKSDTMIKNYELEKKQLLEKLELEKQKLYSKETENKTMINLNCTLKLKLDKCVKDLEDNMNKFNTLTNDHKKTIESNSNKLKNMEETHKINIDKLINEKTNLINSNKAELNNLINNHKTELNKLATDKNNLSNDHKAALNKLTIDKNAIINDQK